MKKVALLALILGSATVFAIPNSVGFGFINVAGMRFEDFAAKKEVWKVNAQLAGDWEVWSDPAVSKSDNIEVLKLKQSATVFGLLAKEVIVYRSENTVRKFRVDFNDDAKTSIAMKTNLGVWADGKWSTDGKSVASGAAVISLETGNAVTFRSAAGH